MGFAPGTWGIFKGLGPLVIIVRYLGRRLFFFFGRRVGGMGGGECARRGGGEGERGK